MVNAGGGGEAYSAPLSAVFGGAPCPHPGALFGILWPGICGELPQGSLTTTTARIYLMATEAQKRELTDKVTRLIQDQFGGDYHKAFAHYDTNGDGRIGRAELGRLLEDAGIGNWLTRGAWEVGIVAALDADKDSTISGP